MNELIELNKYPVKEVLPLLLKDKTTGKNIVFATDTYSKYGFYENDEITVGALFGFESCDIQPRVFKDQSEQTDRTRKKAEVFSPTWICNKMNSHCDSDWFGREDVFNAPEGQMWNTVTDKIIFQDKKDWKKYVDSRRLEITCGEAPYIVSRYDATTGEPIETKDRIGFLDRKLRVVSENTETEEEWIEWAIRAVQSVYGYEFQGDNLLIARINILASFCDYLKEKWGHEAETDVLKKIANIILWNFWQMDGLTNSVPEFEEEEKFVQMALFDIEAEPESSEGRQLCKIQNWRSGSPILFDDIQNKKRGKSMKFDYVIGNPPYQEDSEGTSDAPVYHSFMDASYAIGSKVLLITPARFLFNAGKTPQAWNEKMLNDNHLRILSYIEKSSDVFVNTKIRGGICISYRDESYIGQPILVYSPYTTMNDIVRKVIALDGFVSISKIMYLQNKLNLDELYNDHPEYKKIIGSNGKERRLETGIFEKLSAFSEEKKANDDIEIYGVVKKKRVYRFFPEKYLEAGHANLKKYKVVIMKSNGEGIFGEVIASCDVLGPNIGYTQSYIGIGAFEHLEEAENCTGYLKTKFLRALLDVKKVTQDNPPDTWTCVPLQDFTSSSDIDWSKSIAEIDQQLYRKYGLSDEEIEFIETHVKEMN